MRIAGLLLVLTLLAGGGWWYWTTTPQYSMQQVKEAVKQHDLQKFNKYVDVDTASLRMVDDFIGKPMHEALGENVIGNVLVTGIMSIFKPAMATSIKQEILRFVETGSFRNKDDAGDANGISLAKSDEHLGFRKHALKSIASTTIDGGTAKLELLMHNERYDTDLPLDVTMRKMDGYWQVIELSNFPAFCGKLARLEEQHQNSHSVDSGTNKEHADSSI